MKNLLVILSFSIIMAGCAGLSIQDAGTKALTQYATLKFIEQSENSAERADKIRDVISDVKFFLSSETATLSELGSVVEKRAKLENLSPADRLLAQAVINAVRAEIESRVSDPVINADALYEVDIVLGWIIEVL